MTTTAEALEDADIGMELAREITLELNAPVYVADIRNPTYSVQGSTAAKDEGFDLVFKKLVECRKRERALLKELGRL